MLAIAYFALLLALDGQTDSRTAGLQALDRQDYTQAAQIFSKLAAADPHDYSALFNLALAESALKQDEKAIEHYRQVLAEKPGLYEAELNLGILLLRQHRAADAIAQLREATRQKPAQARPQRYLGEALLAAQDYAGASDAFRAALAADPKAAVAELGLGQSLAGEGKLDEAAPHYRQAASLDPQLKSYLLELATKYSQANRAEEALPLLTQFPNDPGAREEAGRLYLRLNRPAEAVTQFQAAVSLSPSAANRLALASAYLKNNQPDLAAPLLTEALKADPNDYELRMTLGRIYRDKRDFATAANQFVAAAQLKPDSVSAWNEAASVFVMAGQYPQALTALDKVRELHSELPADFYYRAMILDKLHQVKPALESYHRFLEVSQGKFPDQEFIARQRSRILAKQASR